MVVKISSQILSYFLFLPLIGSNQLCIETFSSNWTPGTKADIYRLTDESYKVLSAIE